MVRNSVDWNATTLICCGHRSWWEGGALPGFLENNNNLKRRKYTTY
jgi:hypothetical protein